MIPLKEKLNNELIIRCVEVYMGNYPIEMQYASSILLKMMLKEKKYKKLMEIIRDEIGFKLNDRNDASVVKWKKRVKKIGKCQTCGSRENLVAHHIVPWCHSINGRTDIDNGMCLCKECHKMMHNDVEWIDYMRTKYYGKK